MFKAQSQLKFWLFALLGLVLAAWALKPVLLPFVAGLVIAYFLDPAVEALSRRKCPRWLSASIVLAAFIALILLVLSLIVPMLRDQGGALIEAAPSYIEKIRATYIPWFEKWISHFSPSLKAQINESAGKYAGDAAGFLASGLQKIISGGMAVIDILTLAIITPIVAFYMLRDWPSLIKTIDSIIPRRHYEIIRKELTTIDETLSGFLRGQSLVCVALGIFYAVGLTLAGLEYGLSIGVLAGALSCVPYLGTGFAWLGSLLLAAVQFDSSGSFLIIIAILIIGNVLESYVLAPRFIGHRVGLHPVWLLFALLAGAQLMGFLGLLIAVPVAAVLGVLVRFGIRQYRSSPVYKDIL